MNLDHEFFQVSKLSEDQKMQHFFPKIQVNTHTKKGLHHNWNTSPHFFSRIQVKTCAQMHTSVKLLEGMQIKTILKLFGGDTVKLSPPSSLILGYLHARAAAMLRRNIDHHPELKRCLCSKTGEDQKTRFSPRNGTVFVPENR